MFGTSIVTASLCTRGAAAEPTPLMCSVTLASSPLNGSIVGRQAVTHWRVYLRGENFLLSLDGKPARMGFYTTRFVQANTRDGAEILAVDLIRQDRWLRDSTSNQRTDPPRIFADEIDAVDASAVPDVAAGYTFFPMDSIDA
jgi:hypothetical protein